MRKGNRKTHLEVAKYRGCALCSAASRDADGQVGQVILGAAQVSRPYPSSNCGTTMGQTQTLDASDDHSVGCIDYVRRCNHAAATLGSEEGTAPCDAVPNALMQTAATACTCTVGIAR